VPAASPLPRHGMQPREQTPVDSLRGATVDGAIALDAADRPLPDRAMRRMFDHFLTRLGERDLQSVRDDLRRYLSTRLAPSPVTQTLAWFDRYVALEQESAALGVSDDPVADHGRRRELRRLRLGEEIADAWYGEDERQAGYALARQALVRDRTLDPAARARELMALEQQHGLMQDATRVESDTAALAMAQSRHFATAGTPSAQRLVERQALFGTEAAHRLAALDARRDEWNARVATYRAQRQGLLANRALSDAQRAQRLAELLASSTPNERLRLQALTRDDATPPD
ncbi:MAG: lipase secretion chaperone, partial [Lysobacter sp.]